MKYIEARLKLVKRDVATSGLLVSFLIYFFGFRKFKLVVFNFGIILKSPGKLKKKKRTKLSPEASYWSGMHLGYWNFSQLLGNSNVQPNFRAHLHYKGEIQVCALCKLIRCDTAP